MRPFFAILIMTLFLGCKTDYKKSIDTHPNGENKVKKSTIKEFTARSVWYETLPTAETILAEFTFPVFLKGERQTNRHRQSMSIAINLAELENILNYWKQDKVLGW